MRGLLLILVVCGACSEGSGDTGGRGVGSGDDTGNAGALSGGSNDTSVNGVNSAGDSAFGNADMMIVHQGSTEDPTIMRAPAGDVLEHCSPGIYRGSYTCDLKGADGSVVGALAGDVQFDLAIDENAMAAKCDEDQEFCFDLVIPEGSGTLFGFVLILLGFETQLEGGLDCRSGEFRATAVDGVWGFPVSSDPNDPNAPATVMDAAGTFDGSLAGTHSGTMPQKIEGTWDLTEIENGYNCNGPFTVELVP